MTVKNNPVDLARRAADGDEAATATINGLLDPVIRYHTGRFCKRFCKENRYRYTCTLDASWGLSGLSDREATLCEWGNASYGWMLDDLCSENRLRRFEGNGGARINDYLYTIANSRPFYERWKDWRFGRQVHVPTYIQDLNPVAKLIFLSLRSGEEIPHIAQKLTKPLAEVEVLCQKIIILLTQKNRLHLLDPPKLLSLTDMGQQDRDGENQAGPDFEIPSFDEKHEDREQQTHLHNSWAKLSPVEQYVLEALLIDEQEAVDVLAALSKLKIQIKTGVLPEQTNRQQLYYFRRKTLSKLAKDMDA